ncbi:MAG: LPXTG cell wall anchor domain-containing protein [Clostridia bacterium]|nr:LPXTG cell wall anchor domain-containing protein [Clostridia bacterium]
MKREILKKVALVAIMVLAIVFVSINTFAETLTIQDLAGSGNTAQENTQNTENTQNVENTPSSLVLSSNVVNNETSSYTDTTTLPQTGIVDNYVVSILIVAFLIMAAYAYKKIKEYKNI